jgi:hypothetical protein
MARPARKPAAPAPRQIGDYFAVSYGHDHYLRLKTGLKGDHWLDDDSEDVTRCATREGAERLAALMNQARDLVRDQHLLRFATDKRDRDQIAAHIAHFVAEALDTPHRYVSPAEHTRDMLLEFGHDEGALARDFAILDAAGSPTSLDNFTAAAILRKKHTAILHDRAREVVRAWRRSFDASVAAADRAAAVRAELEVNRS